MTVETLPYRATPSWFVRFSRTNPWHLALFVLVAILVGLPLTFLILGSFANSQLPTDISLTDLGIGNYVQVWTDPDTWKLFTNTAIYVSGATVFGLVMAASLAWLVERSNLPGKIWIYAGVPMTLAMPGMLQAMAYVMLLSPRIGLINKGLAQIDLPSIDVYSLGGMIFVEGLRLVPTAFLMLVPLLRSMDPTLEEAAAMSGANPRKTMYKVTMRVMLPGLLAVGIYQLMSALEVFEVPGILGMPADIFVFSTKIYAIEHSSLLLPTYGQANALAMIYVVFAIATTWAYSKVISKQERFTIVTGKGYRPRLIDLGSWRWAAISIVCLYLLFSIILPFLVFLYVSLVPIIQIPSLETLHHLTFRHYVAAANDSYLGVSLWNTLILVVTTATSTVVLSFLISLVIVRSKFWGRRILDQMAFMPHAIPGIVFGLAFLWVFLALGKSGFDIYGSIWSIAIAFTVSYIAYGTRAMNAAILQVHKDLEEAAQMSGAPRWRTLWRIFFPILKPTFVGVWVWAMLHVVRTAAMPLILYEGPDNQVLSVLIWNMWDQGEMQEVGAIGVVLVLVLMVVTLLVRRIGFGSGKHIQQASH
jgi:iron(III) transport system permease protein